MKRAIKAHRTDFIAILVLLVGSIAISAYILHEERLRFPFIQPSPVKMYAELPTGQAFTPGQGQSVRVSGVQIGEIGQVTLRDGVAVLEMDIENKYRDVIHTDASAVARPRTGLQDMFLEVDPGSLKAPTAKAGFVLPVSNTLPEVNIDEILSSLDADTRSYLNLLVNGAGQGLNGNGGSELAGVLERFLPTHRDLARVNSAVAVRGADLRQLVTSLRRLNEALAAKGPQIVSLIDASSVVFRAFASEDGNIQRALVDLPGTLSQTTATLNKVTSFANLLGPTSAALIPAAKEIPAANAALTALARPSAPIIQKQIRPFVVAARPLVRNLRPAATNLAAATPNLSKTFGVLNHLFNLLGYYPASPQHGYLWWLAWQDHEARTLFSVQDANGTFRPLFAQFSCSELASFMTAAGAGSSTNIFPDVSAILNLGPVQTVCSDLGLSESSGTSPVSGLPVNVPSLAKDSSAAKGTSGTGSSAGSATASATAAKGATASTTTGKSSGGDLTPAPAAIGGGG